MWSLITNPIVSHLLCLGVGAGLAWYATHRTAVATAAAALKGVTGSVLSAVKDVEGKS